MIRFRPSVFSDMAAVTPAMTPDEFRVRLYQDAKSTSWTAFDETGPLAIGGLFWTDKGIFDLWLAVRPDIRGTWRAWPLVRAMARHLRGQPNLGTVRAAVDDSNKAGRGMALMAGFLPTEQISTSGQYRLWVRPGPLG